MPANTDQKNTKVEIFEDGKWRFLADAKPLFKTSGRILGYQCPDVEVVVQTSLNGKRKFHRLNLVLVERSGKLVNMFARQERYRLASRQSHKGPKTEEWVGFGGTNGTQTAQ